MLHQVECWVRNVTPVVTEQDGNVKCKMLSQKKQNLIMNVNTEEKGEPYR
jgi:hypothetical protein